MEKERSGGYVEISQPQRDFISTLIGRLERFGLTDFAARIKNRITNIPTSKEEATVLIEGMLLLLAEKKSNKSFNVLVG